MPVFMVTHKEEVISVDVVIVVVEEVPVLLHILLPAGAGEKDHQYRLDLHSQMNHLYWR